MYYESLNNKQEPEKSFDERIDEELEMSRKVMLNNGVVFTNRTGLFAFTFYRDHKASRQKAKPENFVPNRIVINNRKKKHVIP